MCSIDYLLPFERRLISPLCHIHFEHLGYLFIYIYIYLYLIYIHIYIYYKYIFNIYIYMYNIFNIYICMYSIYLVYIYNIIYIIIYIYMLAYESYGLLLYTLTYIYIYTHGLYIVMNVGISWVPPLESEAMTVEKPPEMQRPVNLSALLRPRRRVKGAASEKVQRIWAPGPRWDVHFWWLEMTKHAIGVSTAVSWLLKDFIKIE